MEFDKLLYVFPSGLAYILSNLSEQIKTSVYEIRLRTDKPIAMRTLNGLLYLKRDGQVVSHFDSECICVGAVEMEVIFSRLCEQSLYSYENTIKNGYIPLRNGCRAGICGDFSDSTYNLRSVYSVNLRIAREIRGADEHIYGLMGLRPKSVLVAGVAGSGKTTVLRELVRRFSNNGYCLSLLDERGELAGMYDSRLAFDIGLNTDVIAYRDKASAANMAVKYMCPDIIAFDELADDSEIIRQCAATGVSIFTTVHAECISDAYSRLKQLCIKRECFDIIAVIKNDRTGNLYEFVKRT